MSNPNTLDTLLSKRPEWREHPKRPGYSVSGESRASYEQRFKAWEAAVERERSKE